MRSLKGSNLKFNNIKLNISNISFRRITSSNQFIPAIDGLRFIALLSVVLFHLSGFIVHKDTHHSLDNTDYSFLNISIYALIILFCVLLFCSVYFFSY